MVRFGTLLFSQHVPGAKAMMDQTTYQVSRKGMKVSMSWSKRHLFWKDVLAALFLLCLLSPQAAYAKCLPQAENALETEFIAADIVFAGIAQKDGYSNVPFRISSLYKSPSKTLTDHAIVIINPIHDIHKDEWVSGESFKHFLKGEKYIVFGWLENEGKDKSSFHTAECSMTGLEPHRLLELVKQSKGSSDKVEMLRHSRDILVFEGRVNEAHQWRHKNSEDPARAFTVDTVSGTGEARLTITRVLVNTTSEPSLQSGDNITVYASTPCSVDFLLGQDYLVFALPNHRNHPDGGPPSNALWWEAGCKTFLLSEEDLLRTWSHVK